MLPENEKTRDPIRNRLEVLNGGGCVRGIGIAFAFWTSVTGAMLIVGWGAGDFSIEILIGGGIVIGTFLLCGLGVATYRERGTHDGA